MRCGCKIQTMQCSTLLKCTFCLTLGQNISFFPIRNYQLFDVWKCEFCEKCYFENVNFVKNETLKMWIFRKIIFWKCEFCEKWDFEIVNFVKSEILKMWILWKLRFWNCEFCQKWDFENVNFVKNEILKMWIFGLIEDFCPSMLHIFILIALKPLFYYLTLFKRECREHEMAIFCSATTLHKTPCVSL